MSVADFEHFDEGSKRVRRLTTDDDLHRADHLSQLLVRVQIANWFFRVVQVLSLQENEG